MDIRPAQAQLFQLYDHTSWQPPCQKDGDRITIRAWCWQDTGEAPSTACGN